MMAKVTVTVCDSCGTQDGVEVYELRKGDQRVKLDLCPKDGAPIDAIFESGQVSKRPGRPRATTKAPAKKTAKKVAAKKAPGRRMAGGNVTTIEEIEKMKKAKLA